MLAKKIFLLVTVDECMNSSDLDVTICCIDYIRLELFLRSILFEAVDVPDELVSLHEVHILLVVDL